MMIGTLAGIQNGHFRKYKSQMLLLDQTCLKRKVQLCTLLYPKESRGLGMQTAEVVGYISGSHCMG